jgi:peptide alpha-N-acetyltransferase
LAKKEQDAFRTVVSCYEQKQYKRGVKTADTILKKHPDHGETQAMKGLILNCMGQKEEAYELVKLGLRNDVRSHVCWHVYGLLYRSDNNYKEAIKCYLNALRIDKNNQNILRDLGNLQLQMRDMAGYVGTARKILEGRPTLRQSWVAFALANFAVKDYDIAYDAVTKYYETASEPSEPYEESEFYLFQNQCLEKAGKLEEAISHLEREKAKIVDKNSWKIKLGQLYLLSGRFTDARAHWEAMVCEQPENYRFHNLLQASLLQLTGDNLHRIMNLKRLDLVCTKLVLLEEQRITLLRYYTDNAVAKSRAFDRIRLFLLQGSEGEFEFALETVIRKYTNDGIPSLCQDIMALVVIPDSSNPEVLVHPSDPYEIRQHATVLTALQITAKLLATFSQQGSPDSTLSATSELWLWFLQAHLQWKCGNLHAAMSSIERAIAHTPTALDMYTFKAKMFKAQGDYQHASECMDQCRSLDLQDRYLNNKATKYFLKNDDFDSAAQTIAMFTKHDADTGDVQKTLFDLQCSWYELEVAESFARQHKWALALKKFSAVRQHFLDQYDDIFDFHSYCLRKTMLRPYVDEMITLDQSFGHKRYQRALQGALKIYLHLLDAPEDVDGLGHLSTAERKKERAKVKKQREKEAAERARAKEAKNQEASKDDDEDKDSKKEDADPYGDSYVTNKDFLQEANTWCNALLQFAAPPMSGFPSTEGDLLHRCSPETLALIAEVNIRKGKYLKALRVLNTGFQAAPASHIHPDLVVVLVKLAQKIKAKKLGTSVAMIPPIVKAEVARLLSLVGQTSSSSSSSSSSSPASGAAAAGEIGNLTDILTAYATSTLASNAFSMRVFVGILKALQIADKNIPGDHSIWSVFVTFFAQEGSLSQLRNVSYENVAELVQNVNAHHAQAAWAAPLVSQTRGLYPNGKCFAEAHASNGADTTASATSAVAAAEEQDTA